MALVQPLERSKMRTVHYDQTVRFLAPAVFIENARDAAERDGQTLSEFCRSAISARLKENGVIPGVRQDEGASREQR